MFLLIQSDRYTLNSKIILPIISEKERFFVMHVNIKACQHHYTPIVQASVIIKSFVEQYTSLK